MAAPEERDLASWMCLWIGRLITPLMTLVGTAGAFTNQPSQAVLGFVAAIGAASAWRVGYLGLGAERIMPHLVLFEVVAATAGATFPEAAAGRTAPAVLLVMVGLFGTPRAAMRFTALVVVMHMTSMFIRPLFHPMDTIEVFLGALSPAVMFGLLGYIVVEITRRNRSDQRVLQDRLDDIQAVLPALERISEGDLSGEIDGEGTLPELTRRMQSDLSALTSELRRNVEVLQSVAGQAGGNALAQQKRTDRMAEVVHEVRALQQQILEQARSSADAAQRVARASLDARKSTSGAQKSLTELTSAAKRISALNSAIKRLAAKSEVLAVNAAIEAHHAGDSGRAFATVAARMQELSEAIRGELVRAEALNLELSQRAADAIGASNRATNATLNSTEAAEQIATQAGEQLAATEKISEAFTELESFADEIRAETADTRTHAAQVVIAADDLTRQMDRFRT